MASMMMRKLRKRFFLLTAGAAVVWHSLGAAVAALGY